jgi:hypothetical protein
MSEENKGDSGACTSAVGLLGLALFIYAMIVFDQVKNKDLVGLNNNYVNMINWSISFAYAEIGLLCSCVAVVIVGFSAMLCFDNPGVLIVLIVFQLLAGFITSIVYVASAVPIKNSVSSICGVVSINTTEMCNFYSTDFNPMVIILIVLLAFNCLNFLIIGCAGGIMCLAGDK